MYRSDYAIERLQNQTRRHNNMLKNTKVVGIAAAITLLTGVAFAPSASAINGNTPTLSVDDTSVDAGDRIKFDVTGVRTGCDVTTKVGSITKTATAKHDKSFAAGIVGWVNTATKAPKVAGEYTVASMISNACATNPGYKRAADMAVDITVGNEVTFDGDFDNSGPGDSVRVYGDVEDGLATVDMDAVKVRFSIKGKVVASGTTDADGYVSVNIAGKYLNSRGDTRVVVSLEGNKTDYMVDQKVIVDPS
jgi:hypothetical protein